MTLELRVLGPVLLTRDGVPVTGAVNYRKNIALLMYLACGPARGRSREHLRALLWPDGNASRSLSQALVALRHELGEALPEDSDPVRLAAGAVQLDLDQLTALQEARRWDEAARLISGQFGEGLCIPDAPAFEIWLSAERRRWQQAGVELLTRRGQELLAAGEASRAREFSRQALELDRLHEPAIRLLMRALAQVDQRAGALEEYQQFVRLLKEELGADPAAETRALAERIQQLPLRPPVTRDRDAAQSRRAPLVGRTAALTTLVAAWEAIRNEGRAGVVLIDGESGSGKTRLSDELVLRARLDGATPASVRLVEADGSVPEGALLGLARGGLLSAPGIAAAPPSALSALAQRLPEWAQRFPAGPGPASGPVMTALSEVIRAAAEEQPILLQLDDAHWADGESLRGLEAILRDAASTPVLVVLSLESHQLPPGVERLRARIGRELAGAVVRLGPLSYAETRELAAWALPDQSAAQLDRIARRVLADSAGLPLLVVELLHAVALGLDLRDVGGAWPAPLSTLTDTLPGGLPDSIVAAMRVGLRRLSRDAREVLCALAMLDGKVTADELARVTDLGAAIGPALDELEWQRIVVCDARGYSFVARIMRLVVDRDLVTQGQRQRMLERWRKP